MATYAEQVAEAAAAAAAERELNAPGAEPLVFLVHDSHNVGSDGFYPASVAAALTAESTGWHYADPETGEWLTPGTTVPAEPPAADPTVAAGEQADDAVDQADAPDGDAEPTDGPPPPAEPKPNRRGAGEPKE